MTLSDSLAAAQQPIAASEASELAKIISSADAADGSLPHANSRQQHCSQEHSNSGLCSNPPRRWSSTARVSSMFATKGPQTLSLLPAKGSPYNRRQVLKSGFASSDAQSVRARQLESARCSLADSCSSFMFDMPSRDRSLQPDAVSDCGAQTSLTSDHAHHQLAVVSVQVRTTLHGISSQHAGHRLMFTVCCCCASQIALAAGDEQQIEM